MASRSKPVTLKVVGRTNWEGEPLPDLSVRCASNRNYAVATLAVKRVGYANATMLKVAMRSDNPATIVRRVRSVLVKQYVYDLQTGELIWSGRREDSDVLAKRIETWHKAAGRG